MGSKNCIEYSKNITNDRSKNNSRIEEDENYIDTHRKFYNFKNVLSGVHYCPSFLILIKNT